MVDKKLQNINSEINSKLDLETVNTITLAFQSCKGAKIPLLNAGFFKAKLCDDGIHVDNLGLQPLLPWQVFTETVKLLREKDGRAVKGDAMSYKLGQKGLPLDSVEGHIADKVYHQRIGDSVFRRITPVAAILDWAGICENKRGYLLIR